MTTPEPAVVVVSAVGVADAVPDAVVVHLTLEVVADEPGPAVSRAAALLADVLAVLDTAGVSERRTTGLDVNPYWDPRGGEGPTGHQAQYSLQVVVPDVATAGELVQRAADTAGTALRVHSFSLTVRDLAPHQAAARADTVGACRDQAAQLPDAAGLRLGRLLRLVEGGGDRLFGVQESGRAPRAMGAGPSVEAGTQEVAVAVTATYALLDQAAETAQAQTAPDRTAPD